MARAKRKAGLPVAEGRGLPEGFPRDFPVEWLSAWGRLTTGFYRIKDKSGRVVPFFPRLVQLRLFDMLLRRKVLRVVAPKSRKLGFSTAFLLFVLDCMMMQDGQAAAIIDQTQDDAKFKLHNIFGFAYDNIPDFMRVGLGRVTDQSGLQAFANGSLIRAGVSSRGATPQFLHISEWGRIAHAAPLRSNEIKTGALQSLPDTGVVLNESTGMGKNNDFHSCVLQAQEIPEAEKTPLDWRLCFSAWWEEPTNAISDASPGRVTKATHEYLDYIERRIGRLLTPAQRVWYQVRGVEEAGIYRFREQPSLIEEVFEAPVEGSVYGPILARIRANGQIGSFAVDASYPIYTAWDIGVRDSTIIWWFQVVGNRVVFLRHISLVGATAAVAAQVVRDAGFVVSKHFLPHDAGHRLFGSGAKGNQVPTIEGELNRAGVANTELLTCTPDMMVGINQSRSLLERCWFDKEGCADGLSFLGTYHVGNDGRPVHDESSHTADAFRYVSEAIYAGLVGRQKAISAAATLQREGSATVAVPVFSGGRGSGSSGNGGVICA